MKIAVCGKGGVGKTTFSGMLIGIFVSEGRRVIGIDADPDPHLPFLFGIRAKDITPIAEIKELIEEKIGKAGFIKLNPEVADIPEKYGIRFKEIKLLVLGDKKGGDGCYCRENILVKRLLEHLLTQEREIVIMDMAAGIEHLTRGTSQHVDALLIIVEPDMGSIQTAKKIQGLANELNVEKIFLILNKITNIKEKEFICSNLKDLTLLGEIPYDLQIRNASLKGISPLEFESKMREAVRNISYSLNEYLSGRRAKDVSRANSG
ncbi:MAG: AAA family ATPase [Candidatus Omnitrophica bacterium]|nr:AAA family ATPase [Candidatus Omnitrophota bacterium]